MNQKDEDALVAKLNEKREYIDDDVFEILVKRIRGDTKGNETEKYTRLPHQRRSKKESLALLEEKRKYIDDDVFEILVSRIKKDLKKEEEDFIEKATLMLSKGISIDVIKNLILSSIYSTNHLKKIVYDC